MVAVVAVFELIGGLPTVKVECSDDLDTLIDELWVIADELDATAS